MERTVFVADGVIVETEKSEVPTKRRVTRSSGEATKSVQNERNLRKSYKKKGRDKVNKKNDKYNIKDDQGTRHKGSCVKDQINRATKLKQIFQQPCVLPNELDDFSSGCTPFRKVVEKKGKRRQTEVVSRPSKKPCLKRQVDDEWRAGQQKCLESDCVISDAVIATSVDIGDGGVCDNSSAGNATGDTVKDYGYNECSGTKKIRLDLSGYKYPGRKRMVYENAETLFRNRQMSPERTRKLHADKKTSDEHRTECKKSCEITDCDDTSTMSYDERVKLMHQQDGANVEMTEGVNGTTGDKELAASLQQREEEKIMEEQLTETKFIFCEICQKRLNYLSVHRRHLHVNNCAERREQDNARRQRDAANRTSTHTLDCPICGVPLKTAASRTSHLKKCAAKYNISTSDLVNLVRQQEKDPREQARVLNKNRTTLTNVTNKRQVRNRRLDQPKRLDEGLQLAVALSTSLQEEQERQAREERIISETTDIMVSVEKPTIPDAFKVLMSPSKSKGAKRDRRQPTKAPSILKHNVEETELRLMTRVTSLVLPQLETDGLTTTTGHWQYRDSQLGEIYTIVCTATTDPTVVPLWERGSDEGDVQRDISLYYVSRLMPPVHHYVVSAGAKLKRMSCIPGWDACDDKRMSLPLVRAASSLDQSSGLAFTVMSSLPDTQTAAVLSELAQEAGESRLSHDDTVKEDDTGDISHCVEPAGYCQKLQEPRVDGATEALLGALAKMVNNPALSDVTLKVQDHELHAHKFMLVARCPHLLELFKRDALSWLNDYKEEAMTAVLRFIYVGDVCIPTSAVQQTHALAERFHLEDLAAVCKEIIESQGETPCSESAAISGDKAFVDLELQHMLKDIWGSDSEDSDDSNDGEKEAENEEEEMEELYEYMSTQRQKLKERRHHGNTSCRDVDKEGNEDDRKTAEDVEMDMIVHQHSLHSCESFDVDVTLKPIGAELRPQWGGHTGCQHSPNGGSDTPLSMTTRSLSARTPPRSDPHVCRSDCETSRLESETPNLNTPTSSIRTPRSDSGSPRSSTITPVLISTGSKSARHMRPCRDSGSSVTSDCGSTARSVHKDLFNCIRETSPNRHSLETLGRGGGAMDTGGSEESTKKLSQSPESPKGKSNEVGLCMGSEDNLLSPGDITVSSVTSKDVTAPTVGNMEGVQLHDSLTETSTLDNSGLDLFESFLADRSNVESPSPQSGSLMHSGSSAVMQNPDIDSAELLEIENELTDSIGLLEYHENQTDSSVILEEHEDQGDSIVVVENQNTKHDSTVQLDNQADSNGVTVNQRVRKNSEDEGDITDVVDRRQDLTGPTALLVRLSSLLSESSTDDNPLTSSPVCTRSDGPLISPPVCVRSDSLGSSFSGSQISSDTPDREILSHQQKIRITDDKSLPTSLDQHCNMEDTYGSAYIGPMREPPSARRSAQSLSHRRNTGNSSRESEAVAREEAPRYDTIDLTQDDVSEQTAAVVTPSGGKNCLYTEDTLCSPNHSAGDNALDVMSPQALTQQVLHSVRRRQSTRTNRECVRETCVAWTTGDVKDLTGDMEQDPPGDLLRDLSEVLVQDPAEDPVKSRTQEPTEDFTHNLTVDTVQDPTEDLLQDLPEDFVQDLTQDPTEDLVHDVNDDLVRDETVKLVKDLTGEEVEEGDSYYDPPTFLGDEYIDLMEEAGKTSQKGMTPSRQTFPQTSLQGGPPTRHQPVTPKPNLTAMETPELKAACHKIGVKAMPKKRMVKLLNHIYEETHGLTPENDCLIQNKATKTKTATARLQKKNLASDTAKTKCRKRNTSTVSSEDTGPDLREDVMMDTRTSPPSSPHKGLLDKRQQIRNFILSHEDIYLKILHYEPLESEEFRKQLKDSGVNIGASVIMDILDEQNIALTTRQNSGWRRKGAKHTKK